ncbi:MAG TPA: hypothetical protein DCW90_14915 [Lachnospiraceae bacterium]|nr:nucleotidyltransferase family protein [uncultured Lachnoclostridium sp.]HAU86726.1 hypothetical protein [Lachnospiraceae bacterium]
MNQDTLLVILRRFFAFDGEKQLHEFPQNDEVLELAFQHNIGLVVGDMMKLDRKQRLVNRILRQKNSQRFYENLRNFSPVATELDSAQIPYCITKGIYAAKTAYVDESYRKSDDLDVVINREDYAEVKKILLENGYIQGIYDEKEKKIKPFTRQQEIFYLSYTQQSAPFVKKIENDLLPVINLDLNFHIFWNNSSSMDIREMIGKSQVLDYKGFQVKTFQDEYMLLHMCLHAYYDMNSIYVLYKTYSYSLKYFADIYGFIKRANINWESFRTICETYQVENYIMYIIYYTSVIFEDKGILENTSMKVPDERFLNQFGLDKEGTYHWEEEFMQRLFCEDRKSLLFQYISDDNKEKIEQGIKLEGM